MKPPYSTGILPLGASGFPWRRLWGERALLGAARVPAAQPKTGRTNYSACLGKYSLYTRRRRGTPTPRPRQTPAPRP